MYYSCAHVNINCGDLMAKRIIREDKKKPTRSYSKAQETNVAKKLNGKCTPNSGATKFSKGDVLTEKFTLECKTKMSESNSITLHKDWLTKNEKECLFMGKLYSALVFNFGPNQKNYYVIDEYLFQDLVDYLNSKEN